MSWVDVCSFEGGEEEFCWGYKMEINVNGEESLTCIIRVATCIHDWELMVLEELQHLLAPVVRSIVQKNNVILFPT